MASPQAPPPGGRRAPARIALAVALVVISALAVGGAFISLHRGGPDVPPAGVDTTWYIWRAELVAGEGLDALPGSTVPERKAQAYRVGYPVLAGFFRSLAGVRPYDLVFALPALMAIVIGLGAGAFGRRVLLEPPWAFPLFAVGVGVSVNVVLTAVGHGDNLIADALLMAAAATAVIACDGRGGGTATVVLLGASVLVHWSFAALFGALLVALTVALIPESFRSFRAGTSPLHTPAVRLAGILAGGAVAGAGTLLLAAAPPQRPKRGMTLLKLARDVPQYGFQVLAPAAAVGAVAVAPSRERPRRRGLLLALIWAGSAAVAVAIVAFGLVPPNRLPAHRVLDFALAIPILAAAAVASAGRLLLRIRPAGLGRALAALVVVAAVVGGAVFARQAWRGTEPASGRSRRLAQAATAARYVERAAGDAPVVIVSQPGCGPTRCFGRRDIDLIRSVMPSRYISRTYVYIGEPEELLRGRPTLDPGNDRFNRVSRTTWPGVRSVLGDGPVVLGLASFGYRPDGPGEGTRIAPGITLIRGPDPGTAIQPAPPPASPSRADLVGIVAVTLLLLTAIGLGWSVSLVPPGWLARVALSPALGGAVLILAGVWAGRLGLDGPGARPWIAAATVATGWAPALVRARRGRAARGERPGEDAPEPPGPAAAQAEPEGDPDPTGEGSTRSRRSRRRRLRS